MGMYTTLGADIVLKPEVTGTDLELDLTELMACNEEMTARTNHLFWSDSRYYFLAGNSGYATLPKVEGASYCQSTRMLKIRTEVRNHDNVIEKFLNLILPYIESVNCDETVYEEETYVGVMNYDLEFTDGLLTRKRYKDIDRGWVGTDRKEIVEVLSGMDWTKIEENS